MSTGPRQTRKQQHPPKKKKKTRGLFKKIILTGVTLLALGIAFGGGLFIYYAKEAPALDENRLNSPVSTRFFAANNELIDELGAEKRTLLKSTEVPKLLSDAIVSVEDKRFYKHMGVDPIRIIGSALGNLKAGSITGGGSTITQQLIKLSFFSTKSSDQTLKRKAQEAWLALKLEREKSKEEILTLYINKVYMGNGISGIGTAAETYYGKKAADLTLPEAALLAGIPNAPSAFNPYVHPEAAKKRRDTVLYTMLQNKKISQSEYDKAVATDIKAGLKPLTNVSGNRKYIDNYLTSAISEVKEKTGKDPFKEGMDIYLNIDLEHQKNLYNIVNNDDIVQFPDNEMQVASTVLNPKTGAVVAQIGGRKIADNVQFGINRATNSGKNGRDVGSTVKPLIDYGPAIEYLNYSTGKIIVDEPYKYPGTDISVHNYDMRYKGPITLRTALTDSRNIPAVKTFMEVGVNKAKDFLSGLGITVDKLEGNNAISGPYSTEELAGAYGAYANEGIYSKPYYVNKIVYPDGTEETFQTESHQAMKDSTAYMITDVLKDVVSDGTGYLAEIPGLIQAGKTGTSNYDASVYDKIIGDKTSVPDVSFVGYTKNYVMAVWTGYDNYFHAIPQIYRRNAALVYKNMMAKLAENVPNEDWEQPSSVIRSGNTLYVKGSVDIPKKSYSKPAEPTTTTTTTTTTSSSETSSTTTTTSEESSSTVEESSTTPESSSTAPSSSSQEEVTPSSSSEAPPAPSEVPNKEENNKHPEQQHTQEKSPAPTVPEKKAA